MYLKDMKLLIVEDEIKLAGSLSEFLTLNGFDVTIEPDGAAALKRVRHHDFDAIILDWLLPGVEGTEILRWMRDHNDRTPVLMLTAQSALQHRIKGLESGADDYVTKPFHPEEIMVRIRGLIRRSRQLPVQQYRCGDLSFNPLEKTLHLEDREVELSQKESDLLLLLFQHQGEPVDRKTFLRQVWGYDFDPNTNVVEVYIRMLRSKLAILEQEALIKTVRGAGYMIPSS